MAPSRAYVPSRALLRALSQPHRPPPCPFARPIIGPFVRRKHGKASKTQKPVIDEDTPIEKIPGIPKNVLKEAMEIKAKLEDDKYTDSLMRMPTDEELEQEVPIINFYEQDLDKGTPRRLVRRIDSKEQWKRDRETFEMHLEDERNPDYDDAHLNRRLLDGLMENPRFAEFTETLKDLKASIMTKEEQAAADVEADRWISEYNAKLRMSTIQALEDLMNDPDIGDEKEDVRKVIEMIPQVNDFQDEDFQAALDKAMSKLGENEVLSKKMAAAVKEDENSPETKKLEELEKQWQYWDRQVERAIEAAEDGSFDFQLDAEAPDKMRDIDKLLVQMRDVMKGIGADSKLEEEFDTVLNSDPTAKQEGEIGRELDMWQLGEELNKLVDDAAKKPVEEENEAEEEEENIPAELQAKVDKIMEDPKLMEKLVYIQSFIEKAKLAKSDITNIAHETAPDPYELEDARTATIGQRMAMARKDPVHSANLQQLRVKLLPPFNVSPALKSFNQAIELAYVGANDDVRRILWRSYQKARTLPTFLQNVSDDAWDILYYSQAVTWGGNQNRRDHLKLILKDLNSLGRDGPPTHPSTLVKQGDGQHLEA